MADGCNHELEDISNGKTLVNVSYCLQCGCITATRKFRSLRADFKAAREEIARREAKRNFELYGEGSGAGIGRGGDKL